MIRVGDILRRKGSRGTRRHILIVEEFKGMFREPLPDSMNAWFYAGVLFADGARGLYSRAELEHDFERPQDQRWEDREWPEDE